MGRLFPLVFPYVKGRIPLKTILFIQNIVWEEAPRRFRRKRKPIKHYFEILNLNHEAM